MEHERDFAEGLTDLERALKDLAPVPARLNISQTMFLAGQQSMRGRHRWQAVWPLSTACLALLSLALGISLATLDAQRVVYVPRTDDTQPDSTQQHSGHVAPPAPVVDQQHAPPRSSDQGVPESFDENQDRAFDRLAWRQLAWNSMWEPAVETPGSETMPVSTVRYRDWRSLLDDVSLAERAREPGASTLLNWTIILTTRGS